MRILGIWLFALLWAFSASNCFSAEQRETDCQNPARRLQIAICADPQLHALEGRVNELYRLALQTSPLKEEIINAHRKWLDLREDDCELRAPADLSQCVQEHDNRRIQSFVEKYDVFSGLPLPELKIVNQSEKLRTRAERMGSDVGKSYYVSAPRVGAFEWCTSINPNKCSAISHVTFKVKSVRLGQWAGEPSLFYAVELESGKKGFFEYSHSWAFVDPRFKGPDGDLLRECEKRGPVVGMSAGLVETCMGFPIHSQTVTGPYGTTKFWSFVTGDHVILRNDVVVSTSLTY